MKRFRKHVAFPVRRFTVLLSVSGALVLGGCATAKAPPAPRWPTPNALLPPNLRASDHEVLQEITTAHGDEDYICRRGTVSPKGVSTGRAGASTQLHWVQAGSEATLVDLHGKSVGTVTPSHYFLSYDGSYVIAKPASISQVSPDALAWARFTIRYTATPRPHEGRFANISSIQRIDTSGGLPAQSDCDLEGSRLLVPYSATYMIYRPGRPSIANQPGTFSTPVDMSSPVVSPLP
jgi:hypothetical protein